MKSIFFTLCFACIFSSIVFAKDSSLICQGEGEAKVVALGVSIDAKDGNTVQLLFVTKPDWKMISEDENAVFDEVARVLRAKLTLPDNTNPSDAEIKFSRDFKNASLSFTVEGSTYLYANLWPSFVFV